MAKPRKKNPNNQGLRMAWAKRQENDGDSERRLVPENERPTPISDLGREVLGLVECCVRQWPASDRTGQGSLEGV